MFAGSNHKSAKTKSRATTESTKPGATSTDSAKVNPLWQSLAMRRGVLQPKLSIGQTDDPYEREADRVADQVMRMPAPQSSGHGLSITPLASRQAQRKCAECEEEEGALQRKESVSADAPANAPPIVHEALNSPGQPLDAATRAYFEPRFGHDFSHVRLHTDARAAESARAVNALAYTIGGDIVFGGGHYAPRTMDGNRLLAHELTHVKQQAKSGAFAVQRKPDPRSPKAWEFATNYRVYDPDTYENMLAGISSARQSLRTDLVDAGDPAQRLQELVRFTALDLMNQYRLRMMAKRDSVELAEQPGMVMEETRSAAKSILDLDKQRRDLERLLYNIPGINQSVSPFTDEWTRMIDDITRDYRNDEITAALTTYEEQKAEAMAEGDESRGDWLLIQLVRARTKQIQQTTKSINQIYEKFPFLAQFWLRDPVTEAAESIVGDPTGDVVGIAKSASETAASVIDWVDPTGLIAKSRGSAEAMIHNVSGPYLIDFAENTFGTNVGYAKAVQQAYDQLIDNIDDAIGMIGSEDIHPFELPEAVNAAKVGLPTNLQKELDRLRKERELSSIAKALGLTVLEAGLALIPVIGPALAFAAGAYSSLSDLESTLDRRNLGLAADTPEGLLGVEPATPLDLTMSVVDVALTSVDVVDVIDIPKMDIDAPSIGHSNIRTETSTRAQPSSHTIENAGSSPSTIPDNISGEGAHITSAETDIVSTPEITRDAPGTIGESIDTVEVSSAQAEPLPENLPAQGPAHSARADEPEPTTRDTAPLSAAAPETSTVSSSHNPASEITPKVVEKAVAYVNKHPELIRIDADGYRHAPIAKRSNHEIVETPAPDLPSGVACEIHSDAGPRIPCPSVFHAHDVGHGAFNVSIHDGQVIVYDAGTFKGKDDTNKFQKVKKDFKEMAERAIPGGVIHELHISHVHGDHYNMVQVLSEHFTIERVVINHFQMETGEFPALLQLLEKQKTCELVALSYDGTRLVASRAPLAQAEELANTLRQVNLNPYSVPPVGPYIKIFEPYESGGIFAYAIPEIADKHHRARMKQQEKLERRRKQQRLGQERKQLRQQRQQSGGEEIKTTREPDYSIQATDELSTTIVDERIPGLRVVFNPDSAAPGLTPLSESNFHTHLTRSQPPSTLWLLGHHFGSSFFPSATSDILKLMDRMIGYSLAEVVGGGQASHVVSASLKEYISPEVPYLFAAAGIQVLPSHGGATVTARGASPGSRPSIPNQEWTGPKPIGAPLKDSYLVIKDLQNLLLETASDPGATALSKNQKLLDINEKIKDLETARKTYVLGVYAELHGNKRLDEVLKGSDGNFYKTGPETLQNLESEITKAIAEARKVL